MKFKSLIITLLASSIFLTIIICIWKILATLQGLSFTNLNFNLNLLLSLVLTMICITIGKKLNHILKIFILSLSFTILYTFFNESSPLWFSLGIFLLTGGASGTLTLPISVYQQGFAVSNIGMGSAVSIVIVLLLITFMIIYFKLIGKKANEI